MSSEENPNSLADMLENYANQGKDMPKVNDVEVMIRGIDNLESLESVADITSKYGITLGKDGAGKDVMTLDKSKWKQIEGDDNKLTTIWQNLENSSIQLETTLHESADSTSQQAIMQMQSESGVI